MGDGVLLGDAEGIILRVDKDLQIQVFKPKITVINRCRDGKRMPTS